jgi:hypothetical protein
VAAPELEQIVAELQPTAREIALALIRQELSCFAASLNGSATPPTMVFSGAQMPSQVTTAPAATPDPPAPSTDPTTKRCSACGELLPPERFAPGRRQCRRCRNRQATERERRRREPETAGNEEPPRPGVTPA